MKLFIPIKQHSERLPNKNFLDFHAKPLWMHTLDKFKEHEIYIDTDSYSLKKRISYGDEYRNCVPYLRSPHLVGDDVSVNLLIEDCIKSNDISEDDYLCQIHITNPLLRVSTVERAYELAVQNGLTSVSGGTLKFKRLWGGELLPSGEVWVNGEPYNHDPNQLLKTQDLNPFIEDNSTFYIFNVGSFLEAKTRIISGVFYPVDDVEALDIDTIHDFKFCEDIYELRKKQEGD